MFLNQLAYLFSIFGVLVDCCDHTKRNRKNTSTKMPNIQAAPSVRSILDSEIRAIVIGKRMNEKGAIFHEIKSLSIKKNHCRSHFCEGD